MKIAGGQEINTLFTFQHIDKIFIFASNINTGTYKTISLLQNYKTE